MKHLKNAMGTKGIALLALCLQLVALRAVYAQVGANDSSIPHILKSEIIEGDTLPHIVLAPVTIIPPWNFTSRREYNQYHRLIRNIRVALPFARTAARELEFINSELAKLDSDRARRNYLREAEARLFAEFEQPLRRLTFSQGKLLIKLLDRETGETGFELIREYRGGVSAFFWQGVARLFGADLKEDFDPETEDRMIEHIITLIDLGML